MDENHSKEPWCPADLFFLGNTLKRGMKPEEVAGFLGRTMGEVTAAKAKELRITVFKRRKSNKDDGGSRPDAATSAADGDR